MWFTIVIGLFIFQACHFDLGKDSRPETPDHQLGEVLKHWQRNTIKEWHSDESIIPNLMVCDKFGDKSQLSTYLNSDHTFVLNFHANACEPCVDDYIELVNGIFSKSAKNRILLIFHQSDLRTVNMKAQKIKINPPYLITDPFLGFCTFYSDRL